MKKNSHEKVLKDMEKKILASFKKIKENINKDAPLSTLKKNSAEMMLLLGEINYLAKEIKKANPKKK